MSATTCASIGAELVAYLDGALADDERRPVAAHVSTCLGCRREMERLAAVQRALDTLPRIEPSPHFADDFWRQLAEEAPAAAVGTRRVRLLRVVVPALAAAAVLALAFQAFLRAPATPPMPARYEARTATAPAAAGNAERRQLAARHAAETEAPRVADVDTLRPEDLPPELVEHPELYLRLPVVRRLQKLEYFGSVPDRPTGEDGAG